MVESLGNILAESGGGAQLLIVVVVVIISVLASVFEKVKQKPTNTSPRPPIIPPPLKPVNMERPTPPRPAQQRRPVAQPKPVVPPRQRVQSPPPRPAPTVEPKRAASGVLKAVEELTREAEKISSSDLGSLASRKSLTQIRAEQAGQIATNTGSSFSGLTPAELRRAIILNEILGPPLALRTSNDQL